MQHTFKLILALFLLVLAGHQLVAQFPIAPSSPLAVPNRTLQLPGTFTVSMNPVPVVANAVTPPVPAAVPATPEWQVVRKPEVGEPTTRPSIAGRQRDPNRLKNFELKPMQEVQLSANESGTLIELNVAEGTEVTYQQLLARQDDQLAIAQRDGATADKEQADFKSKSTIDERYAAKVAEVALKVHQRSVEANRSAPGTVSEVELAAQFLKYEEALLQKDKAIEERQVAKFTVRAKQAEVSAAEDAIRRRQILAPFAGTIIKITPKKMEWLKPGDPVLRIISQEKLYVEGYANKEQVMPNQLVGRTLIANVEISRERGISVQVPAKILFVSPEFSAGGDYSVRAEIVNRKNPQTGLWELSSGLTAELLLNGTTP